MRKRRLPRHQPLSIRAGINKQSSRCEIVFTAEDMAEHMAVYGGTGKGKSKFFELMLRQLIGQGAGVCVIDPHGDLVEDLLAFIVDRYDGLDESVMRRIHYFEPGSTKHRFSYDPFHFDDADDCDYEDWLRAKVESMARTIIRKQGETDFEGKPRLERFLTNILYACGVRLNARGDHLSLADVFDLLDTSDQAKYEALYNKIHPHLPKEIQSDFAKIRNSSPRQQEEWVGSTINRLRSFMTPAVRSIFQGQAQESVSFRRIVEESGVMLVNLRRTRGFTIDQGNAIGGLFINEIMEAVQTADRVKRKQFYLFIDEASRFVGQDLCDALGQFRKMKLSLCLAVQDLSSFKKKDIDMTAKVLSQCGLQVTFQQKFPIDFDLLGQMMGYACLDFTPLLEEVDRFNGYEWTESQDRSTSESSGTTSQTSESRTEQFGLDGLPTGHSEGRTTADGMTHQTSESKTTKATPLAQYRTEIRDTGRLRHSIQDQLDYVKAALRQLGKGEAIVSGDLNSPFILRVHQISPGLRTLSEQEVLSLVDGYKQHLGRFHPYCFEVQKSQSDRRIAQEEEDDNFKKNLADSPFDS